MKRTLLHLKYWTVTWTGDSLRIEASFDDGCGHHTFGLQRLVED